MDNQSIITYKSAFDAIMHEITADDGSQLEVWYARELQKVCGYARWENFQVAINRAIDACKSQNINIDDHFRDVTKMIGKSRIYYKNARKVSEQPFLVFLCKLLNRLYLQT